MKPNETQNTENSKKPDLRKGMHGSLLNNSLDAGQRPTPNNEDEKLATPDPEVPVGQTTHE
jgi:hypothetical protein